MKKIVKYSKLYGELELNRSAIVWPINHTSEYVSNTKWATTSAVIRIGENGEFETENSIYQPQLNG